MANECTLMVETELPISMTVNDGVGIEKGEVLALKNKFGCSGSETTGDVVAGIAAEEKIASDGNTKMSVYRGGFFKGTASGSIAVGDPLQTVTTGAAENYIGSSIAASTVSGSVILGTSMENCTDDQTFLFELKPTTRISGAP